MTSCETVMSAVPVLWVHVILEISISVTTCKASVSRVPDPVRPDSSTTENFGSAKLRLKKTVMLLSVPYISEDYRTSAPSLKTGGVEEVSRDKNDFLGPILYNLLERVSSG